MSVETGEITRFTELDRARLIRAGVIIHELTGQSIESLREQGHEIGLHLQTRADRTSVEGLGSRCSQVGFMPAFFLAGSGDKNYLNQEKMFGEWRTALRRRLPGVTAVMGEAPDYAELAVTYLEETGRRLFGASYARTLTPLSGGCTAIVGQSSDGGVKAMSFNVRSRNDSVRLAPLIVPRQSS